MTRHDFEELAAVVPRDAGNGTGLATRTIVGIGLGIGTCIFVAILVVAWMIMHKRSAHRKYMAQLEAGARVPQSSRQDMREVSRPGTATSANGFTTWAHLGSNDEVDSEQAHDQNKRKRNTVGLPKRIKQKGVTPLKAWTRKHLSVIAEHPANGTPQRESSLPIFDQMQRSSSKKHRTQSSVTKEVVLPQSGSPKFDVLPSFATRSPGQLRTGLVSGTDGLPKLSLNLRSVSMGILTEDGAVFGPDSEYLGKRQRPEMRARSASLGAPSTRPPSGPVPPLPAMSIASTSSWSKYASKSLGLSRSSSSSSNSAGSSVLMTSPILERRDTDQPLHSPTVEDLIEANNNAALKSVANRQWQNRRPSPTRCCNANSRVQKPGSIRGRLVRSSTESSITLWRSNSSSTSSSLGSGRNRLSVPQICSAEKMSISRVSSSNSLLGSGPIGKITTPTKRINKVGSISSVSIFGSPAERKRVSVLREVSGNAPPSKNTALPRDPSDSTLVSRSSSNGNPFHWDNASVSSVSLPKASALKGSPNARKGHRRQNCVRISTLTPQVLGPSVSRRRSRSISPANLLQGVIEERESIEMQRPRTEPVVTPAEERQSFLLACGGQAPKANAIELGDLRIQTLRASLTPSSPTLSNWNTYQPHVPERPLPPTRQVSRDSVYSLASNQERSASRLSNSSFSIPKFPSPAGKSRPSLAPIQCDTAQGPHFVGLSPVDAVSPLDNLSPTDFRPTSSAFALVLSPEEMTANQNVEIPSSPPLPISKTAEYDPASPQLPSAAGAQEYDPTSPPSTIRHEQDKDDGGHPGFFLPFTLGSMDLMGDALSAKPKSESPPCSPKTVSRTRFDTLIDAEQPVIPERNPKRTKAKLTSENASTVMASTNLNFPGDNVPVLLPTKHYDDEFCPMPRWESDKSYENMTLDEEEPVQETFDSRRVTLARPPLLSTIVQESSSPPPMPQTSAGASAHRPSLTRERTASPLGPRDPPAKSILRNVTELRRMNSDAKGQPSRESRNYVRLGREPSPLLPWIPSTTNNETDGGATREGSHNSLCDFDFERSSSYTLPGTVASTVLDEIDFEALEKSIDTAVKGLDEDWRYSQIALQVRRDSDKENQDVITSQQQQHNDNNNTHQRSSSVWDDGEQFWKDNERNSTSPKPKPLCVVNNSSPPRGQSPKTARYWAEKYQKTLDPRMLSTPVRNKDNRLSGVVMVATPKSLYDAEGFLRT
ncbi:hypothetical protein CKM354_001047000 [Cercospora kikuchii]|uniref:Uncharacterized protein n=1 Tax=Cercospora kikuchii TaxID=84275 RepID=A0A9P3CTM8_9PEZI|nr:uncharacterized protein CKM354_001047000 [Cercospora kikuchii]GIZ47377.1 hypothetical protein CKM354_001047000 [Cercospora kikuchii]